MFLPGKGRTMNNSFSLSADADFWGNWNESGSSEEICTRFPSFYERSEQEVTTYEAVVLIASYSQLCPTPTEMLERATCSLFSRVSGGNAGRPASQLCSRNIAIWCWCHSAPQTPKGSGRNLTPGCNTLFIFKSNVIFLLLEFSSFDGGKGRAVFLKHVLASAEQSTGKWEGGPCRSYGEESTTAHSAPLLVTTTSRTERNASTHLLLDTSCA